MKRYMYLLIASLLFLFTPLASHTGTIFAGQELIVSAAASLTNAFGEIGKAFENANPGTTVVFNFAASGALLQQIDKGAPVDVFASADQKTMDQAREKNLILPNTRTDFAGNELVIIIPDGAKTPVLIIGDLTRDEVGKIALGNPDAVPAGRYAQEVLINEGIRQKLTPKLVLGNSVRQVLDYVSRGEVDAGFVFTTDAVLAKEKIKIAMQASNHKSITYPISVVSSSRNIDLAKRFVDFVMSEKGREILIKNGFKDP